MYKIYVLTENYFVIFVTNCIKILKCDIKMIVA